MFGGTFLYVLSLEDKERSGKVGESCKKCGIWILGKSII